MVRQKELVNPSNTNFWTWMKSATLKASWSLKRQSLSVVTRGTAIAIGLVFSAHQRVFGSSLLLPGRLLSHDPIDRQLLTADPYTDFQRTNDMRAAAQRALFKQNSARAEQAAGLARHRSQPRDDVNAGDTAMVWRNNKLTGRRGWTGPGVVVAVSPTKTSFWISMRDCLLKCSSEQVLKRPTPNGSAPSCVEPLRQYCSTVVGEVDNVDTSMWSPRDNQRRSPRLTQDQTFITFWVLVHRCQVHSLRFLRKQKLWIRCGHKPESPT